MAWFVQHFPNPAKPEPVRIEPLRAQRKKREERQGRFLSPLRTSATSAVKYLVYFA